MVSPAYQRSRKSRIFQLLDGHRAFFFVGQIDAGRTPQPDHSVAYSAMLVDAELVANCVKEHVAGLLQRVP